MPAPVMQVASEPRREVGAALRRRTHVRSPAGVSALAPVPTSSDPPGRRQPGRLHEFETFDQAREVIGAHASAEQATQSDTGPGVVSTLRWRLAPLIGPRRRVRGPHRRQRMPLADISAEIAPSIQAPEPAPVQGFRPRFETSAHLSENRGVPGSSPGLAIREPPMAQGFPGFQSVLGDPVYGYPIRYSVPNRAMCAAEKPSVHRGARDEHHTIPAHGAPGLKRRVGCGAIAPVMHAASPASERPHQRRSGSKTTLDRHSRRSSKAVVCGSFGGLPASAARGYPLRCSSVLVSGGSGRESSAGGRGLSGHVAGVPGVVS
jgi:hypothetical protein